jgi:hypothetical protein
MKRLFFALILALAITGCGSHVVQITLVNASQQPIKTIIVDYPGATFGKDSLPPGGKFLYKIKPQETGPIKIQFNDAQGNTHNYTGPMLHKNDEGGFEISLTQDSANATPASPSR